ncbi:MAG: DUF177 domain-containing protein [Chloroflexi bacterium]|nr:DUF177 domain-containing protein [Chloroflexota bacterium]
MWKGGLWSDMQFNVARLMKEPIGSDREHKLNERFAPLEGTSVSWVEGRVKLTHTDKGVWVHGSLKTSTEGECSRCLKRIEQPVAFELDEEYFPSVDVVTGLPLPAPDPAEGTFLIGPGHILDLQEAVRQYIIAGLPLKPLCRADCQGLCPQCGTDWNERRCDCSSKAPDPRWDSLRQILTQQRRGG